jgi:uncharacterized protein YqgC (DUF456 family)
MTQEQILGFALAMVFMLIGTIGTFVPVIPGTPILLVTAVVHKVIFGQASVGWFVLILLVLLTGLSFVVEYAGQAIGAKKLGATWKGIVGAIGGGLIGLFFGIPGIILGPFVGAVVLELLGGRGVTPAAKAGSGAVLGLLLGAVGKVAICVAMMVLFVFSVFYNTHGS